MASGRTPPLISRCLRVSWTANPPLEYHLSLGTFATLVLHVISWLGLEDESTFSEFVHGIPHTHVGIAPVYLPLPSHPVSSLPTPVHVRARQLPPLPSGRLPLL